MKRVISLLLLIAVLLIGVELLITRLTKEYEITYKVYSNDKEFIVIESYQKDNNDTYDIEIKNDDVSFYYEVANNYNKQKKIIKNVEMFENNGNVCIYPTLKDDKELYIECMSNGTLYTAYSYPDTSFIQMIKNELTEKGYNANTKSDLESVKGYRNSTLYTNNLPSTDTIVLWNYKGISTINSKNENTINSLTFDKYDNNLGVLVDKYYVVPNYTSNKLLEFSSVTLINVKTGKKEKVNLGYTLSSDTYINGVIKEKIYYTDPSNLTQIEFNPSSQKTRLLGNAEIGGQTYEGSWKDRNIYDFRTSKVLFKEYEDLTNYSYISLLDGGSSYYFNTADGNVYQVPKKHLDKPILLFNANSLNNFTVIDDDIYYVLGNTLYYFNLNNGSIPILVNNDLIYNTNNRISIYREK